MMGRDAARTFVIHRSRSVAQRSSRLPPKPTPPASSPARGLPSVCTAALGADAPLGAFAVTDAEMPP